jgi:hypothetical protein
MRGNPVLVGPGILVGQGGGYAGQYFDFQMLEDSSLFSFTSYVDGSTQNPCSLPWAAAAEVTGWSAQLQQADFFNIPQPANLGTFVFYLGLAVGKRKPHFLYWTVSDDIPSSILSVNVNIRQWLGRHFLEDFGTGIMSSP